MSIDRIFKRHTPEDFSDEFQADLGNLKHEIDLQLTQAGGQSLGGDVQVSSLAELLQCYPDVFNEVMFPKPVKGQVHHDRCHAFYKSPAFQAVLLQDDEPTFWATMHGNVWYTLSGSIGRAGAHSWLYQMPYRELKLCEKSLFALIAAVADCDLSKRLGEGGWHQDAQSSLQGFNARRDFSGESKSALQKMVASYFTSNEVDRIPPSIHVALRDLVYNESLKLKSASLSTHQIIDCLHERVSLIYDQAVVNCVFVSSDTASRLYPLFQRQVLINAFAPFAEDLAYLDGLPMECYGHLHPKTTADDQKMVADLLSSPTTACLQQIFNGPLFSLQDVLSQQNLSPLAIGLWLEQVGQPIDLDAVFTGSISNMTLKKELLLLGRHFSAIDTLLCEFPDLDKTSDKAMRAMAYCEFISSPLEFSHGAKIGYAIALIEIGITNQVFGMPLQSGKPAHVIHSDPTIGEQVLKYLRGAGLFNHEILSWCGYGSEILPGLAE